MQLEDECGTLVEWYWRDKTEVLGEKPAPIPLCPPQILHGLTWDRTLAFAAQNTEDTANYIYRLSSYRAVNTFRLGYTKPVT